MKRLTSALSAAQEDNIMVKVGQAFIEMQNKNYAGTKELLSSEDLFTVYETQSISLFFLFCVCVW